MKELYNYIATLLGSITSFELVDVWNNQVKNSDEFPLFAPSVYYTASVIWTSMSSGVRKGEATVNVYIVTEVYETQPGNVSNSTAYLLFVDEVYQKLSSAGFVSVSDIPDTNHSNVVTHVSTYRYEFIDNSMKRTNDAAKIKIEPDLTLKK